MAGIDFDEINVSTDKAATAYLVEATGGNVLLPTVEFDGRIVSGYQPDVYDILLKESKDAQEEQEKEQEKEDKQEEAE